MFIGCIEVARLSKTKHTSILLSFIEIPNLKQAGHDLEIPKVSGKRMCFE